MRAWYRRWRTLIGEMWRFGLVGATNVLLNFVLFNALVLTVFPGSELTGNLVATAIATTSSYLMNRGWTFRHRKTTKISREYVLFFVFNGVGLGIELAVMALAKYGLGLDALWALNLAKLTGLGLGTVFRFWTYRNFVFAGTSTTKQPPIPAAAADSTASRNGTAPARVNGTAPGGVNGTVLSSRVNGTASTRLNGTPPPTANGTPATGANGADPAGVHEAGAAVDQIPTQPDPTGGDPPAGTGRP